MDWKGKERRKFPRAVFPCKIIVNSSSRQLHSHTENLSKGGTRVILEEPLERFTTVRLELSPSVDTSIHCKGRVIWVIEKTNPIEDRPAMYDTGIEFVDMNGADKAYIQELLESILSSEEYAE